MILAVQICPLCMSIADRERAQCRHDGNDTCFHRTSPSKPYAASSSRPGQGIFDRDHIFADTPLRSLCRARRALQAGDATCWHVSCAGEAAERSFTPDWEAPAEPRCRAGLAGLRREAPARRRSRWLGACISAGSSPDGDGRGATAAVADLALRDRETVALQRGIACRRGCRNGRRLWCGIRARKRRDGHNRQASRPRGNR